MAILSPLWRLHYQSPCNGSWWCNSSRMHFWGWAFAKQILSRSERMILPGYICIYNVSIYFVRYIFPMTFPVCFCLALAPPLLEAKSTQCHCLWGAFAEFLTLDFRAWPRRNRTSCFSDQFFSFSEMEVNWSSRLRTMRNISMQVVGSCFCLCSRMLGGAFTQQLDKAVIQDVIHAGIFRYI